MGVSGVACPKQVSQTNHLGFVILITKGQAMRPRYGPKPVGIARADSDEV